MANQVIKKDGTKEPFQEEKIKNSIAAAARMANLSGERITELTERVYAAIRPSLEAKEEIATSEIKEMVLAELDVREPSVAESWRKYDEEKGKN